MTIPPASAPISKPDQGADLVGRYASELIGELRCFDRVIMHGTLIDVAHPGALLISMHQAGFKPKDLTRFAQPITQQVRDHIIGLARQNDLEIEMCLTQVEYAHDLVFKNATRVDALFEELARQALLAVKVEDVARFLGKRLPMGHDTQVNSHLGRRHEGLRLKHSFGPASVKLYNKPGGILRLEMTTYDVSFFRHYRQVVHQDGTKEQQLASMKKSIYSLSDLAALMRAGVQRYSQWLASLDEHTAGHQDISRLSRSERDAQGRPYRGFNPFLAEDERVLQVVFSGEHALVGLTARRMHRVLTTWSRGRISRLLKRLRLHGLLRKIGHTYTYHITSLGRRVVTAVLHLKNNIMVPKLSGPSASAAPD